MTRDEVIDLIRQMQPAPTDLSTIFKDDDADGVPNTLDLEPNTPTDCPVDTRGIATDSDGDGVKDCNDKEPYSPPGGGFSPDGVATKLPQHIDCSVCRMLNDYTFAPLYFDEKSYCLSGKTQASLKNTAHFLSNNTRFCIVIEGYVDDKLNSAADNAALSYNRAKAVADFLINNYGISADRLKIKIKGEDNVIKTNLAEKNISAFNRRVEIYVTDCATTSDEMPKEAEKVGKNCKK